jgi:phenylacetate-coenzyme A ligase PaaK-like adenylate-forming protein
MSLYPSYTLADVLAVADIHPFYDPDVQYPPDATIVQQARDRATETLSDVIQLKDRQLLWKKDLYTTIQRLISDTSPENTFRRGIYTSITGGGGTGKVPLCFATDVHENRAHRAKFGAFLRSMGLVSDKDWVVTVHQAGGLYRSLDLTLEILENAGASVLAAGAYMKTDDVIGLISRYRANVISGDANLMVQLAHHISKLTPEDRANVNIDKIIYTSEGLAPSQRDFIFSVLGPIKICSILGSTEGGPYAVSCPHLVEGDGSGGIGTASTNGISTAAYRDFVFDTRMIMLEILPADTAEDEDAAAAATRPEPLGLGEQGLIAMTSLTRLRNPVVRYMTGDVGSLHDLPVHAKDTVPEDDWPHLRLLRLRGRDTRFSFAWDGEYIQLEGLDAILGEVRYGVLQWQVILDKMESMETSLEVRLLRPSVTSQTNRHGGDDLLERVRGVFKVSPYSQPRFSMTHVDSLDDMVRSGTGRKVVKFVNRVD